ncbi:MAG: hypothetical protein ACTHNW_14745, partial [Mucilaginibacter sp.]
MKKTFIKQTLLLLAITYSGLAFGQTVNSEEIVRRVADNIVQNTSCKFVNSKTGEKYDSTNGLPPSGDIKADSKYNKWAYVNGVLTIGMMQTAQVLNDKKYSDYSLHNFNFIFSNILYFQQLYKAKTP